MVDKIKHIDFQQNQCLNIKSSIYAPSRSYLWGIVWWILTGSCITGNDVIGNDITGTGNGNEREIISRAFPLYFPRFFRNSSRF
jgi:hypothetical protein